jgi:hypothetical protein
MGGGFLAMDYAGTFHSSLFWLLAIPFILGFIGEGLYWYSWRLANKKGFRYDYEIREASWTENGQRLVYKWKKDEPRPNTTPEPN